MTVYNNAIIFLTGKFCPGVTIDTEAVRQCGDVVGPGRPQATMNWF